MAVGTIGSPTGDVIVPIQNFTQQTKELTLTVTSAQAGWSTTRAVGIFYADSAGVWRLKFNVVGSFNTASISTIRISLSNVTFYNGAAQSVSAYGNGTTTFVGASADSNSSNIDITWGSSGNQSVVAVFGDVELASEPTAYTTAANLEGNVNVAAYFPTAAAGIKGLVDNTAGNTTGTPILGKTDGVSVAAGYVGEVVVSAAGSGITAFNGSGTYVTINSIPLTKGTWFVTAQSGLLTGAVSAAPTSISFGIATGAGNVAPASPTVLGQYPPNQINSSSWYQMVPIVLIVTASSATYYLNQAATYPGGNNNSFHHKELSFISATRIA